MIVPEVTWNAIRMKEILLYITGLLLFTSCDRRDPYCNDDSHYGITITNNSITRIRYHIYWNYPDTLIGEYNPKQDGTDGLTNGESFVRGVGRTSCWESYLMNGKKEWIYFFNADTIETLDWSIVRQTQRGLLIRKEINEDSLLLTNYRINYP